jgi:hypothetical protein
MATSHPSQAPGKGFQMWERGVFLLRCDSDAAADAWVQATQEAVRLTRETAELYASSAAGWEVPSTPA